MALDVNMNWLVEVLGDGTFYDDAGSYVYLSNSFVGLRFEKSAKEHPKPPAGVTERAIGPATNPFFHGRVLENVELPKITECPTDTCDCCEGAGGFRTCEECDEEGLITCDECGNDVCCGTCDGTGAAPGVGTGDDEICTACDGSGAAKDLQHRTDIVGKLQCFTDEYMKFCEISDTSTARVVERTGHGPGRSQKALVCNTRMGNGLALILLQ